MNIASFNDLLTAAKAQTEPQRLLFVFAGAELPDDSTAPQRDAFAAGHGGALVPLMCVDKSPDEIASFDALLAESLAFGHDWALMLVVALSGSQGRAPAADAVQRALDNFVDAVRMGTLGVAIPFDRQGVPVVLR